MKREQNKTKNKQVLPRNKLLPWFKAGRVGRVPNRRKRQRQPSRTSMV